jgi:hypothetical protein
MKFKCTRPFIAFGITAKIGDMVELTDGQAAAIQEVARIAPYELKILPTIENKTAPKRKRKKVTK